MNNFVIRESKRQDLEQILNLYRELIVNDSALELSRAEDIFDSILNSEYFHLFVLEINAKIVSSCVLNIIPNLSRGGKSYAIIENVITLSTYRKKGFGSAIMKHSIEYALEKNCYKIMLQTGSKNPNTHSFYKKLGFSDTEKKAFVIKKIDEL